MRIGTIAVREKLPSNMKHITDTQIQEALWHYYYDVEKSVGYLVSTYAAKPKPQEKKGAVAGGFFSFGMSFENTFCLEAFERGVVSGGGSPVSLVLES